MLFIPIVLSLIVLAAHSLRSGNMLLVVAILGLAPLLAIRRPWVARVVQVVLVLGALEWLRTAVMLAMSRSAQAQPFLRMLVILGVVTAVTLASGLLFQSATLRRIYGVNADQR